MKVKIVSFLSVLFALIAVGLYIDIPKTTISAEQIENPSPRVQLIHSANESRRKRAVSKAIQGSVAIKLLLKDKVATIGTGAILNIRGNKVLITAEHVVRTAFPIPLQACSMITNDCISLANRFVIYVDKESKTVLTSDWVMFSIEKVPEGVVPLKVSAAPASVGDELWLIGHPWGRGPWVSKGTVAWVDGVKDKIYFISSFAAPGFSGGGVFDQKGNIIAITVAIAKTSEGLQVNQVIAIPLTNIWPLFLASE